MKEIEIQKDYLDGETIRSIYFGGGTPSLLDKTDFENIFLKIGKLFRLESDVEISIEVNPDDISPEKAKELKELGFNRISIGTQSFIDRDLEFLTRRHNSAQNEAAITSIKNAGFTNISADLIYGIPSQETEDLEYNISRLIMYEIPHISAYSLTVEPQTLLHKKVIKGDIKAPEENKVIEHFDFIMDKLQENKYLHYEISNYCLDNQFSKHNSNYWKQTKYLGIGPSAHSYNIKSRQWNISNINKYISSLEEDKLAYEIEYLSDTDKYNEAILLGLRTMWGCSLNRIKNEFGEEKLNLLLAKADKYLREDYLIKQNNTLYLRRKGKYIADKISSDLFLESEDRAVDKIHREKL